MKKRKCTRYIAECGRGFWSKKSCLTHEKNCKCWINPRNRTCKTCQYGSIEDHFWGCYHPNDAVANLDRNSGLKNVDYISVNCVHHKAESKAKAG